MKRARKIAQWYQLRFGESIPVSQLVQRVASVMQEYTQSGSVDSLSLSDWRNSPCPPCSGVRPFGVSLLVVGYDEDTPYLFQCDPSVRPPPPSLSIFLSLSWSTPQGAYFAWKATAIGKNYINGKTFLEKR